MPSCPHLTLRSGAADLRQVGCRGPAREGAHAGHERRTLGSGNYAARVHQVEEVRTLEAMVVGGKQRVTNAVLPFQSFEAIEEFLGLLLVQFELGANRGRIAAIKTIFGELLLLHQTNVTVSLVRGPAEIVDALHALKKRANTLQSVSEFDGDGVEVDAAALLEVGELGDLETVQKNLPPDTPRTECRGFPVVLFKTNVVLLEVDADGSKALEINVLHIHWRGLEDHLKLGMLVEAVRILAVTAVGGPTTGLNIADPIA